MTYIFNDPTRFVDEFRDGFVAVNSTLVSVVPGGVIRAEQVPPGHVAIVTGGGSGHYPAFAGIVGPGLAHGAAMGNIFASPSSQQIYTVAKAANAGGGILLTYGNYAGDVLNFDQAQERLIAEGIPCRTVTVTDDISSAPASERYKRRGVAGDLAVFKVAGAAAEEGRSLDEVWELANRANERTRSLGVAFTGCTLPGTHEPLFTIPEGRMGVGMGIHGEPGISEQAIPRATELAALLVSSLLKEIPADVDQATGSRLALILNGLGAVTHEELFVLYVGVERELKAAGLQIVEPEVGELVTSFEMAGVSLTLCWLDDELERLWRAPAYAAAYRKGVVVTNKRPMRTADDIATAIHDPIPEGSEDSRWAGHVVLAALTAAAATIDETAEELGRIDAVAGDGDHGIGMQRGANAAVKGARNAVENGAGAGTVLSRAGDAWADRAGGTSGALWGIILRSIGDVLGDEVTPDARTVAEAVAAAAENVRRFGKAERGDKTMLDVLIPFSEALSERATKEADLATAWSAAAPIAEEAARDTVNLVPRIGRARPHAEKSLGTPDAGAYSMALIIRAVATALQEQAEGSEL